jgi:D-alanyl-D-alanine carboxypeptidase
VLGIQARVADGRQRFAARSGVAELNTAKPVPFNGKFRIGSVTKTFVATVVRQLAGEGEVDLDAPVDRYLPNLLPYRDITVRQVRSNKPAVASAVNRIPMGRHPAVVRRR